MKNLQDKTVVVIGGTSGMGLAIAKLAFENNAKVVIGSRSPEKLEAAAKEIGDGVAAHPIDTTIENSVSEFFETVGEIDHLIVSGSEVKEGKFREISIEDPQNSMQSKFWGPFLATRAAKIKEGGSIVPFSGAARRKPALGAAIVTVVNAAVEAFAKVLAAELAPVRVNVVSPGLVRDTGAYLKMPEDKREAMFKNASEQLPLRRVGTPDDIAQATMFLLNNKYVTGTILDVEGGALIS